MDSEELKPCKICGSCGYLSHLRFGKWIVECLDCPATTDRYVDSDCAITCWNTGNVRIPSIHGTKVSILVELIEKKIKRELSQTTFSQRKMWKKLQ